ncbi:MAG: sulfate transporter [Mycobacterium sp.]|nr:sulfate transporter [Mycobacterium sp.]
MFVARIPQPNPDRAPEQELVRVRELGPATVLLTVLDDIDAADAPTIFDRIVHLMTGYSQLVLDVSRVSLFGTAGLSMLRRLDLFCARAAADWVLVVGPEVTRLLTVCEPGHSLPVASNIVSAAATLARGPHRTPQLSTHR